MISVFLLAKVADYSKFCHLVILLWIRLGKNLPAFKNICENSAVGNPSTLTSAAPVPQGGNMVI
jgi:hypothetical protein